MSSGTVGFQGFGRTRALEFPDGQDAPTSPSGRGSIRYNDTTKQFEASVDGATYEAFGGVGGGGTTVPNFAAVSALDDTTFDNGANVAVASVRDFFELDTTSTLAVDGVTVLATLSGTGRWVRRQLPSTVWSTRDTWHINALTGDDQNDGATAGTALATHAEIVRRVGMLEVRQFVTVNIDSDLTEDFYISFNCVEEGGLLIGGFAYVGTPTTIRSSTFTAGTQPWVYNPAGSRQDGQVEDTSLGGAGWELGLGRRLRVTSGAAVDSVSWVARDLGADVARVAPWFDLNFFSESAGPSSGDSYVVEQLPTITGGHTVTGDAAARFADLYLDEPGFFESPIQYFGTGTSVTATGSELRGTRLYAGPSSNAIFLGCRIDIPVMTLQEQGRLATGTCMATGRLDVQTGAIYQGDLGGGLLFQNPAAAGAGGGTDVTGPVIQVTGGDLQLQTTSHFAIYDMTAAGATGMLLQSGGRADMSGTFWGRDNTMSYGVRVGPGCQLVYNPVTGALPDVETPALDDTLIGGVGTAYGGLPATNATNFSSIVLAV